MTKFKDALCIRVLAALVPTYKCWGKTEAEISQLCGCKPEELLGTLRELLDGKYVKHIITQEGTAGPYAHRYWLADDVDITVSFLPKAG